ncbi:hypothetical protein LZ683_08675 [Comamonas testosteroni]|uniref:hypothetical protein n=1 Tax=Comamonas testosteroni TaxID=285 RepID=UPI0023AB2396|nr:hypothetical protein [Comamonas testosteroni]WEE79415.1 hypothetical protein LZ683_08675 [Comamonas testosteroni]
MTHEAIAWIAAHGGRDLDFQQRGDYLRGAGAMEGWSTYLFQGGHQQTGISKHLDLELNQILMLEIFPDRSRMTDALPIRWNSVLKIADARYVRVHGQAHDFPSALVQAESYVHESRQISALTWWKQSDKNWVSWLCNTQMEVRLVTTTSEPNGTPYWHFEVSGDAPSLEEAALMASMRHA